MPSTPALPGEVPPVGDPDHVVARANILLPGVYAWISTVAYPASAGHGHGFAPVAAGGALLCLLAGTALVVPRPRLGRLLGLVGFVAFAAVTWLLLGEGLDVRRLEPMRSALGGAAWALFAFGWGSVRRPRHVPEDDPRALVDDLLRPRRVLPRRAPFILGAALLLGLAPVFVAWRIVRPEHALLGHAAAFAAAVSVVSVGALVAAEQGRRRETRPARIRLVAASGTLALAGAFGALGLLYRILG
jgi:hypothetical protein